MSKFRMLILLSSVVSLLVMGSPVMAAGESASMHQIHCSGSSYYSAWGTYIITYGGQTTCTDRVDEIQLDVHLDADIGRWVELYSDRWVCLDDFNCNHSEVIELSSGRYRVRTVHSVVPPDGHTYVNNHNFRTTAIFYVD